LQTLLGGLFELAFTIIVEAMRLLLEAVLELLIKGTANAIYGNRKGALQTIARWLLYIAIIASVPITIGYMIYEKPFSPAWTALTAIAGIFSLVIVVIGERQ
jgi:hypothetical protein